MEPSAQGSQIPLEERGAGRKLPGPSPSSSPLYLPPVRPEQSPTRSRFQSPNWAMLG